MHLERLAQRWSVLSKDPNEGGPDSADAFAGLIDIAAREHLVLHQLDDETVDDRSQRLH